MSLLKSLADQFFKSQKVVWDRDRELTNNKTMAIKRRTDLTTSANYGVSEEYYSVFQDNIPCHLRTPTLEELDSKIFTIDDILLSYYSQNKPELDDIIFVDNIDYKIVSIKYRDRSERVDLLLSKLEV